MPVFCRRGRRRQLPGRQQEKAGQALYHAQVGAVITNQYFTAGGKALAESNGVLLWDRDWITQQLTELEREGTDLAPLAEQPKTEALSDSNAGSEAVSGGTVSTPPASGGTGTDTTSQGSTNNTPQNPAPSESGGTAEVPLTPANPRNAPYILNTSTKKFHVPSCTSAGRISAANRAEFSGTREELLAMGYAPCKICGP